GDKYKINNFIKKVSKLPLNSEKENLRKLILNIEEKKLNSIVKIAYKKQLISQETNMNLIDELYKRRNSIVHGKDDPLLRITLPSIVYDKQNIDWIEIIKEISTIIIEKFCFEEN
ncbi:MAG: hypothetical protein ACRDDH_03245, partial [Cetobacterium sp.]|uniref:hypothetical protein n=1 Tax=Cetobacterium sp. TaxID=2071632 RepID=UPI003EE4CB41